MKDLLLVCDGLAKDCNGMTAGRDLRKSQADSQLSANIGP
jgi:hypothetical protein